MTKFPPHVRGQTRSWVSEMHGNRSNYRAIQQPIDRRPPVSHSQMLKSRRTKQRHRKQLANIAKRAKKLRKQESKMAGAAAPKTAPA